MRLVEACTSAPMGHVPVGNDGELYAPPGHAD
jgi:hypothetical protein